MALSVNGLGKEFDGKWVLEDVSIEFEPGHVHGLVGHNGSGKSTLIKILAGYHAPSAGSVTLNGHTITGASSTAVRDLGIRFVHQDLGLISEFTAVENMGMGGVYSRRAGRRIDWKDQARRLNAVLAEFGSDVPLDVPVCELSAVHRSLIAIARAVETGAQVGSPTKFLVLDEPTTALQGPEIEVLFEVVRSLCRSGIGVIYVSHNLRDVIQLGSSISVLRNGRCVQTFGDRSASYDSLLAAMLGETLLKDERVADSAFEHSLGTSSRGVSTPRLSVRGLHSSLLRGVNLDLYPGECVCVMGLSGSGREQLAYALSGAVPSSFDTMTIEGKAVGALSPLNWGERQVALVPGNRMPGSSIPDFTMRENLSLVSLPKFRRPTGTLNRKAEQSMVRRWVERLEIRPNEPEYSTRNLSGGNRQKVILAKWLESDPQIVLIDEPTAGVDVGAAHKLLTELRQLVAEGRTLLVSTSEVGDVLASSDRVIIVSDGKVAKELRRGEDDFSEAGILAAMNQDFGEMMAVPFNAEDSES